MGLEAQREVVTRYLASTGGDLLEEYVEVETGKQRDRPVLLAALEHCRSEKAVLVIAKLDRLARNVAFVSSLMESRTEFVAVDAPFANRLMVHILAAFAEHEREQIALRTKAALAAAKARGVRLGANGAVLARARIAEATSFAEQLRPAFMAAMVAGETLSATAERLNATGLRSREGAAWCPTRVRRVMVRLRLPPYADTALSTLKGPQEAASIRTAPFPSDGLAPAQRAISSLNAGPTRPR